MGGGCHRKIVKMPYLWGEKGAFIGDKEGIYKVTAWYSTTYKTRQKPALFHLKEELLANNATTEASFMIKN